MNNEARTIRRSDCNEKAWSFIRYQGDELNKLGRQLVELQKKLCRYEGHLPISDYDGQTWCELCNSKLSDG